MNPYDTHHGTQGNPDSGGLPPGGDWRNALPDRLRRRGSFDKFRDVAQLAESYLELEQRMSRGVHGIDLPGPDSDPIAWDQLYDKLGRPRDPMDYEIPDELPDVPRDPNYVTSFRRLAHKIGLLPGQVRSLVELHDGMCRDARDRCDRSMADEHEMLRTEAERRFGRSRIDAARKAVRDHDQDAFDWLDRYRQFDNPHVMALLTRLIPSAYDGSGGIGGDRHGRDREYGATGGWPREDAIERPTGGRFAMSPAEAEAEIDRLRADKSFLDAYLTREHPGHDRAVRDMTRLFEIATAD